jgi:putative ABC transport system permease protein
MHPLFRLLLRLYPADFARQHAAEMWLLFHDRLTAETRARGRMGGLHVWRREVADHVRAASAERRVVRRARQAHAVRGSGHLVTGLATLGQDLRFGVRQLRRRPGFTVVAALTLALGIGATSAVFTVLNGVLLRPLPYPGADRIVALQSVGQSGRVVSLSPADFRDYREQVDAFTAAAAYTDTELALTGAGDPQRVTAQTVTPAFFDVMGVPPLIGRPFTETDFGASRYVVLSNDLWRRAFGADPAIVGRGIMLDGERYAVTGVMPPGFDFPDHSQLWVPLIFTPHELEDSQRGARWVRAVARVAAGSTVAGADGEVAEVAARLADLHPDKDGKYRGRVVALVDTLVAGVRPALVVLQAAVGLVLLIACANVANLLLVRAADRRTEVAIRTSIGASRGRLIRQFLTESLVLGALGGAGGFALAVWAVHGLLAIDPRGLPRLSDVAVVPQVLMFTAAVALAAGFVFGAAPAVQLVRADINASLREGSRPIGGGPRGLRASLVVAEIALALTLVVGAGLLLRSFYNLWHVNKGYDAHSVLTFSLSLPEVSYSSPERITGFYHQLFPALRGIAGVESAGMIFGLPLGQYNGHSTFSIEGRQVPDEDAQNAYVRVVGGEYFRTMRIPVREGRTFTSADSGTSSLVAMLNETAARRYFPEGDAIGHRLRVHATFSSGTYGFREIVGIVGDVKHSGFAAPTDPEIYVPYDQQPLSFGVVTIRTTTPPMSVATAVAGRIHALDSALPVAGLTPMTTIVADSVASDRFTLSLLGIFAALALCLAAIGIYGVMSYAVTERTREIGVRMALGAAPGTVLRMVVADGLRLTAMGVTAGLAATALTTRGLAGMLFGVGAGDPVTYATVTVVIVVTAVAACLVPARRATRVEPLAALRRE